MAPQKTCLEKSKLTKIFPSNIGHKSIGAKLLAP